MPEEIDHVQEGRRALQRAGWQAAKDHFEAALRAGDNPEAHDGLGVALWWLNDIAASHHHRSLAYNGFRKAGDRRRAAEIATWLAREQVFFRANFSAMKGWFARANSLLGEEGPCREQAWLALMRASMLASPEELMETARSTRALAQEFGDSDLEALALAFNGLACINLCRIDEGMACLDEAMTMSTGGELAGFQVISEVFCVTLSSCELACDLVRTEHWCLAAADFARQYNCQFLSAYCRTTYGALLAAQGRWVDAEEELLRAITIFEEGHRALRVHALLKLADLRVSQGRLEEAQALLSGYEDQGEAALPLARLHQAKGEFDLARAVLQQALGGAEKPALHQAPLLLLLTEVLITSGEIERVHAAARQLGELARSAGSALLLAQAELAEGQVRRFTGEPGADVCFQSALNRLRSYEQSLVASRARLEMAHLLRDSDRAGAMTWARAALASFERLGASQGADAAAKLLRELGATGRAPLRKQGTLTRREQEVLALLESGLTNREIAGRLFITAKTAEHHVSRILDKLGARTRAEVVALAQKSSSL